jgi:hypothetical protein
MNPDQSYHRQAQICRRVGVACLVLAAKKSPAIPDEINPGANDEKFDEGEENFQRDGCLGSDPRCGKERFHHKMIVGQGANRSTLANNKQPMK